MEHSPSWEANRFSATQQIPAFYGLRMFITKVTHVSILSQLDPVHAPTFNFLKIHLNLLAPELFLEF